MRLEGKAFPSMGVSCLVSSSNLAKSSSSSESVLALNASNSGFVVESRESDFFELVDKVVEFMVSCSFWDFRKILVDRTAFEAA